MKVEYQKVVTDPKEFYGREKDLYQIWINFCNSKLFINEIGLRGFEAGILNEHEGPDFQGAELELAGKIYRGDVEIHKNCSDWIGHGHHLDPRYDRVVLHLVMDKSIKPVTNSKDQLIPTISMSKFPDTPTVINCSKKCNVYSLNLLVQKTLFKNLALHRMQLKAKEIKNLVASQGIDQTLYLSILKCLGNIINKHNYMQLAQIVPWRLVHYFKTQNKSQEFWQALFLGSAGFINITSSTVLQNYWKNCQPIIEGTPINKNQWRLGGLRPYNYPQNRLAGMAKFIWELQIPSIFLLIKQIMYERLSTPELLNKMYYLFDAKNQQKSISSIRNCTNFWGRNLIVELTGNVIIPLFYKIAKDQNSFGFESYLNQVFLELPKTQNYGTLNSIRKRLNPSIEESKFFYINQSLLYLQNSYCVFNNFHECPLQTIH